jgi:hypothetical protein
MRQRSLHRNGGLACVVLTAVAAFSACSPGDSADRPAATPAARSARACGTPADSVLGLATAQFVKFVRPRPDRFLVPEGTDSAVPRSAYWALQTTGATVNVLPRDTAVQRKGVQQLSPNNVLTLLLVNYHGQDTMPDGRVSVEFSGHYLAGAPRGTAIPRTAVLFDCAATGERFVVEKQVTPAP